MPVNLLKIQLIQQHTCDTKDTIKEEAEEAADATEVNQTDLAVDKISSAAYAI